MPEHGEPPQQSSATLHHKARATAARVKASAAGAFWTRLSAVDFINSSLMLAALILMCFLPFLIVLSAAAGRDVRRSIIIRMGLNHQAAAEVDGLISSGQTAVTTLSLLGLAWLVFGAFGISATLQGWYRKVYDEPPSQGAAKAICRSDVLARWIHRLSHRPGANRPSSGLSRSPRPDLPHRIRLCCRFLDLLPVSPIAGQDRMAGRAPQRDRHWTLSDRAKHLFRASSFVNDRLW